MNAENSLVSAILSGFILTIISIYPLTFLGLNFVGGLCVFLLIIIAIYFLITQRKSIKLEKNDGLVIIALSLFFIVSIISSLVFDFSDAQGKLSKFMVLPLVIPIYFLLRHIKNLEAIFWYATALGAIVSGGIAIYDIIVLNEYRALGDTHPIIFGNSALLLGAMSMTGFNWFKAKGNAQTALPIIAFVAGIVASALSASRGGWIAIPAVFLLLMFYFKVSLKTLLIMTSLLLISLFVVYSIPQTGISERIDKTMSNIQRYADSDMTSPLRSTSIGTRFEMWYASTNIVKESPLLGVGWGHYREYAQKQVDAGLRNQSAAAWGHPHNQYFSVLVASGLLGFIGLMALFLIPLKLFLAGIKSDLNADHSIYYAGLMHVILIMHFALSEAVLERSRSVTFIAFYLVIILALVNVKQNEKINNNA